MKKVLLFVSLFLFVCLLGFSTKTWTVDDNRVECPDADFTHPQDAVNAASPGDIIKIYPGEYRNKLSPIPAPVLIVYKDRLSIVAADPDPSKTVFYPTGGLGCGPGAVATLTNGAVNGNAFSTAITIIASDVTVSGFTLIFPTLDTLMEYYNCAPFLLIGQLDREDSSHLGSNNNTVSKCAFGWRGDDYWNHGGCGMGILISYSSGNMILDNTLSGCVPGYMNLPVILIHPWNSNDPAYFGYSSRDNKIINNDMREGAITVGAWWSGSPAQVDNSGTKIHGNKVDAIGFYYSAGRKIASGNERVTPWNYDVDVYAVNSTGYIIPGNANHEWPAGWKLQ